MKLPNNLRLLNDSSESRDLLPSKRAQVDRNLRPWEGEQSLSLTTRGGPQRVGLSAYNLKGGDSTVKVEPKEITTYHRRPLGVGRG